MKIWEIEYRLTDKLFASRETEFVPRLGDYIDFDEPEAVLYEVIAVMLPGDSASNKITIYLKEVPE
jgi:hypothetical protein